ncbi:hypothetical protein B7P43_G10614 [Cryptotermes secundus]|uniref:Uncharacterized protein n=1 Tax=Cryptotermes secundus TaxID=105785 RepID=A0A2J7QXJ7_9NEOP|nr:hypothetical protein B7P43_G10614 [Cryptotermes secundus]
MGINSTKKGGNLEIKEMDPKKKGIQKNGKEAKKREERNKLQTETIREKLCGSISGKRKRLSLLHSAGTCSGLHRASISVDTRGSLPTRKAAGA